MIFFHGKTSISTCNYRFGLLIGVVYQPVKGVVEEGAVGLVKGIGKGLIGVVTRPLGGGVDLLTATFGSLQKAVSGDKVLVKKRHPRFIGQDKVISVSWWLLSLNAVYYLTVLNSSFDTTKAYINNLTIYASDITHKSAKI